MVNQVYIYFLLFMIYAIIGWLIEGFFKFFFKHSLINGGFFIGPYLPIYGWVFLLITILFNKYFDDFFILFLLIALLSGVLEYSINYLMEKIFNIKWWNCKKYKFNINERICLEKVILVGVIGMLILKFVNPFFIDMLIKMNSKLVMVLAIILLIVFVIDGMLSEKIVERLSKRINDNKSNNDLSYLEQRLLGAYPNLIVVKCK